MCKRRKTSIQILFAIGMGTLSVLLASMASVSTSSRAFAQDNSLANLVDLVVRKGYKDISMGQLCDRFSMRSENPKCAAIQMSWEEGGLRPLFNTYKTPNGTVRVIIVNHDATRAQAYLTNLNGKLEAAATGVKVPPPHIWNFTKVTLTSAIRAAFEKEVAYWKSIEKEVADVPDRKD